MKKLMMICVVFSMCLLPANIAKAEIQVDFYRCYAPNAYGSSSYDTFWSNAQHAVLNNLASYGSGNSEFKIVTEVSGVESYVTSYASWNGVEVAGEYGGRASWVYHIYDDGGALLDFTSMTKEYFDDLGGTRESTAGWGPLAISGYDATRYVGVDTNGNVTTNPLDDMAGFLGLSGNSWWHAEDDGVGGNDFIANNSSTYWDDRFTLLAASGLNIEQNQTHWGLEIGYHGTTYVAPDIAVTPEPASLSMLAIGGLMMIRRKR